MAIVSAAIAAITAAVVSTTVASVATAAVAVGTLIGTVGIGLSVVGMVTGNKTLSKVGGYLGLAGGVLTLGGGLAGGFAGYAKTLSSAWDDGVGSMFSSTKSVGQETLNAGALQEKLGKSIVDNSLAQQAAPVQTTTQAAPTSVPPASSTLGPRPQMLPPPSASAGASPAGANPLDFAGTAKTAVAGPDMAATQFANAAPVSAPSATAPLSTVTAQANTAPLAGAALPASQAVAGTVANVGAASKTAGTGVGSFFSNLPDWAKAQVAISGAQGLAGMAGGWFEGATAEEKLQLEREAQQWRMQHEDSIKNFNQQNASFAPRITFGGGGMLSKGANA